MQDPEPGSKYARWMADVTGEEWLRGPSTSVWWCQCFVSWCLDQVGQSCTGYPSYNTDYTLSCGPTLVYREDVMPGDIVIWDWNGDGATDHVGIVSYHVPGELGYIQCVEGNHNNAVEVVDRSDVWNLVSACIRPPFDGEGGYVPPNRDSDYVEEFARAVVAGDFGNGEERMHLLYDHVQRAVNAVVSGNVEGLTRADIDFANAVIDGDYGNQPERMYNVYATIQAKVNELLA